MSSDEEFALSILQRLNGLEADVDALLRNETRYLFLRDFTCFVARWEPDSRWRVYNASETPKLLHGGDPGSDTADEAIDRAMKEEDELVL